MFWFLWAILYAMIVVANVRVCRAKYQKAKNAFDRYEVELGFNLVLFFGLIVAAIVSGILVTTPMLLVFMTGFIGVAVAGVYCARLLWHRGVRGD